MKLLNSIVVMKHRVHETLVIDSVLLVKHPEGCDPAQLIHAALSQSTAGREARLDSHEPAPKPTADIAHMDWSDQQMHIEQASSWFVLDMDQCMDPRQPEQLSTYQFEAECSLLVP